MIVNMRDYSNKNIPVILYLGDRCDRDEDTDIIVVNPTLSDELYETPMWKFDTVYALCSVSSWESYLETIRHDFQGIRLTETDVFNCEKNDDIVQLIALIERVLQYRECRKTIMTFEEYEEMVRNRPTPDTQSYYSLKIWSFDKSRQWKECFSKIGDVPCYRRPVSSRQIEFATREEALEAMNGMVDSYKSEICAFVTLGIVDGVPDKTNEGYENYLYLAKQMIRDGKNVDDWLETTEFMGINEDEMSVVYGPLNAAWDNFDFFNPMRVLPAPDNLPEEIKAELRFWYTDALNLGK